ncbi:hypothetical protein PV11_04864 [Exophiala sideris]|uniref:Uncharacterized protein n=1 Tax=Exophiala sideris TaxID=1016849 RepID=A0A0D1W1Z9_9EURO|nr:hypothetical protein PV11_04864 [Exophiala sideris]
MPLFKSTNKSHSSIEESRTEHPHHQPHPSSSYRFDHNPDRYIQQPLTEDQYQFQDPQSPSQPYPTQQQLSRSQSVSTGEVYGAQRPSVNLHPPPSQSPVIPQPPPHIPGQTLFGHSKSARIERDEKQKRPKQNFITGLIKGKSRDEDREREKEKENTGKGIGRSASVHLLKSQKSPTQDQNTRDSYSQQISPSSQNRHSAFYPPTEAIIPSRPSDQPQQQGQSVDIHQQIDYEEDAPRFDPEQEQYHPYHQTESSNTSDQWEHPRHGNLESDQYRHLGPPSQTSLGPPSPSANPAHSQFFQDSRPSTAATNRYSVQSGVQGQPPTGMAGGDPRNGSLRQQMSQRDNRAEEHNQYQNQDPRVRMSQQSSEQGRSTPPPRSREDISQLDYNQLLQRHEELQAKYSKVKRYYFEREAQVTQLQNTVANQRLSMSRTSLDDGQYTARFERLSQAINNLSFNIRKNWRAVPPWLRHVCNQDAHTIGTKEMTAVGRACITRWLYESIFERTFHPGIDPGLSGQLKNIERNLRRSGQAGMLLTDEQRDDLITKITTWRLTTIEGLQDVLGSNQAEQYTENLTKMFTHQLTESLKANLTDPPPAGLTEGVGMIVGQAIGVAANIPLESRDISIEYFMPGTPLNDMYMKAEPALTALTNPGPDERLVAMQAAQAQAQGIQEGQEGDGMSTASTEDGPRDRDVEAEIREAAGKAASQQPGSGGPQGRPENVARDSQTTIRNTNDKQSKKSSFLGGIVGKKPSTRHDSRAGVAETSGNNGDDQRGNVRESMAIDPFQLAPPPGANEGRIRFAAFVAVEVRGKGLGPAPSTGGNNKEPGSASGGNAKESAVNVLFKAPVYEY